MAKQKLMTKELERQFPKLYSTEKVKAKDKKVIAKFFSPSSNYTWYAVEYDPKIMQFFGLVDGHELEWGYFSLEDFEEINAKFYANQSRVWIERDMYFGTPLVSEVRELQGRL
jgi:hypothetical protein